MSFTNRVVRAVNAVLLPCVALVAVLALSVGPAWSDDNRELRVELRGMVFVGDSLTTGFQNFSIYDSESFPGLPLGGQKQGYAALIAYQAGISLNTFLPLIRLPGLPPALEIDASGNITRKALPPPGFPFREDVLVQTRVLAVPGFTVADGLARTINLASITDPIDAMAVQVLGFPGLALGTAPCGTLAFSFPSLTISEVACAISLRPTLVVNWLGNNDALQSLTLNIPPTNPLAFAAAYHMAMTALNTTKAPIVVANIPDVSVLPFLIPVPAFELLCHFHPPGTTAADFIVPNLVDPTATSFEICTNFAVRSASLIASTQQAVSAYNKIIEAEAKAFDAVLVDINKLFDKISKKGFDVNGQNLTTAFLGGLFSLDGIHPTNTGYAILANEFIDAMNEDLDTSIPRVSVEQVAKNDPLVFGKH